jgi:hypothetical protein
MKFIYVQQYDPKDSPNIIMGVFLLSAIITVPFILYGIGTNVVDYIADWESHEFPYNYISVFYYYVPLCLVAIAILFWCLLVILNIISLIPIIGEMELLFKTFELIIGFYRLFKKKITWAIFFAPAALGVLWFLILSYLILPQSSGHMAKRVISSSEVNYENLLNK